MKNDANLLALIDIERYLLVFEAIKTQDYWLAVDIAQSAFVASLCLLGRASGILGFEIQVIARINLLNRQSLSVDDANRLWPPLNELLRYQSSMVNGTDRTEEGGGWAFRPCMAFNAPLL